MIIREHENPRAPSPAPIPQGRLALIDALRGIAALWVVLVHADHMGWAWPDLKALMPGAVAWGLQSGYVGVAIFFVLSGFVIAHNIGRHEVDRTYVWRFMLRRSVRLDPPYWASIVLVVAVMAAKAIVIGQPVRLPGVEDVLAHLTYTQDILGIRPLSVVYWTLCLEIQFYLLLVLLAWTRWSWPYLLAAAVAIVWPVFKLPAWPGTFLTLWHGFLLGTAVYRVSARLAGAWPLYLTLVAGAAGIIVRAGVDGRWADAGWTAATLATSGLILAGTRTGGIATWLSARPLQWLGATSYSLYLTHTLVLGSVLEVAVHLPGPRGAWVDAVRLTVGFAVTLVAARILWRVVEVPSQRLARRVSLEPSPAVARASASSIAEP